jgi:putative SOS response-associated peptidase YedK
MCGRFAFYSPAQAAAELFGVNSAPEIESRYNIAPTQYIAAIRPDGQGARQVVMLRWGLVPFWAKDPSIGARMINARAETVAEKPSFRTAFRKRRCLVLADGYYEWQRSGEVKVPWFISRRDDQPMAFAGLWESWKDPQSDSPLETVTIITTEADRFLGQLHHRMPVILDPDQAKGWLEPGTAVPPTGPVLRAWPVDRRVNNARNEGPELVEPVGEALGAGVKAGE